MEPNPVENHIHFNQTKTFYDRKKIDYSNSQDRRIQKNNELLNSNTEYGNITKKWKIIQNFIEKFNKFNINKIGFYYKSIMNYQLKFKIQI